MSSRPNVVLGLVVAAVLVVAVVAVVLTSGRSETEFPAGTPEATVQVYLRAVLDQDVAALDSLEADTECGPGDIAMAFIPDSARAVLVDSDATGDQATVRVEIAESPGDSPFAGGEWTHEEVFALERGGGGEWHIVGAPWPFYACEGRGT